MRENAVGQPKGSVCAVFSRTRMDLRVNLIDCLFITSEFTTLHWLYSFCSSVYRYNYRTVIFPLDLSVLQMHNAIQLPHRPKLTAWIERVRPQRLDPELFDDVTKKIMKMKDIPPAQTGVAILSQLIWIVLFIQNYLQYNLLCKK